MGNTKEQIANKIVEDFTKNTRAQIISEIVSDLEITKAPFESIVENLTSERSRMIVQGKVAAYTDAIEIVLRHRR